MGKELRYLYTIAANLCKDAFHRRTAEELDENIADYKDYEDLILTNVALGNVIKQLSDEDKEIIILRYINDVPIGVLGELFGMSRFRMSRRIRSILRYLKNDIDREEDLKLE